ncbi:MAG: hypothetical protein ACREFQ_03250 [Stellaceae bacterium]
MRALICAAALALAGCGSFAGMVPGAPERDVLGVSADQPRNEATATTATAAATRKLAYKQSQLCTNGVDPVRQDVEPAQQGRALVDWQLRCRPYHFTVLGQDLAGLVPY